MWPHLLRTYEQHLKLKSLSAEAALSIPFVWAVWFCLSGNPLGISTTHDFSASQKASRHWGLSPDPKIPDPRKVNLVGLATCP